MKGKQHEQSVCKRCLTFKGHQDPFIFFLMENLQTFPLIPREVSKKH